MPSLFYEVMKMCNNPNVVLTTAVAVSGSNLVLTIPSGTYANCYNFILRLAQSVPLTATNLMPVVIQIGTGETLYPLRQKAGHNVYANQLKARRNYMVHTAADTATFTLLHGILNTCNCGTVESLPVPTTTNKT